MNVSADSSFIVALYLADAHSLEARRRMAAKLPLALTPFNRVEVAHAIYFQVFRGRINLAEAERVWHDFEDDCARRIWILRDLPSRTWETGIGLACRFGPILGIRTLDSLHVACALELCADKFWTFDERQAKLAQAVGLDTTP